jgi:hypothetical protein
MAGQCPSTSNKEQVFSFKNETIFEQSEGEESSLVLRSPTEKTVSLWELPIGGKASFGDSCYIHVESVTYFNYINKVRELW